MSEPTKRPWRVEPEKLFKGVRVAGRSDSVYSGLTEVAKVYSAGGLGPANAELIVRAVNSLDKVEEALREIAKGEGPYNRDPLEHAANCIEHMKETARTALAAFDD